jgi:hypothetical protein
MHQSRCLKCQLMPNLGSKSTSIRDKLVEFFLGNPQD